MEAKNERLVLWAILVFMAGIVSGLMCGCNTVARTSVAFVQGVQEDISSSARHAGQQASHGTRDAETERQALEGNK